jgi:hypothetical protein
MMNIVSGWVRNSHEQAGSEFNTPRNENTSNFRSNVQEKAATRGGQRGALQFSASLPYNTPNESLDNPPSRDHLEFLNYAELVSRIAEFNTPRNRIRGMPTRID